MFENDDFPFGSIFGCAGCGCRKDIAVKGRRERKSLKLFSSFFSPFPHRSYFFSCAEYFIYSVNIFTTYRIICGVSLWNCVCRFISTFFWTVKKSVLNIEKSFTDFYFFSLPFFFFLFSSEGTK